MQVRANWGRDPRWEFIIMEQKFRYTKRTCVQYVLRLWNLL